MEKPVPIYKGKDFYVPQFKIAVGGKDLDPEVVHDILRVTYRDNIKEMDSFEFTVNNWDEEYPTFRDAKTRTFKYSDRDLFDPGRTVELQMGYFGKDGMRLMTRGEITSLRPAFPASGGSTLVVSGLNMLHRLRTKQVSDRYENLTDSKIAARIAKRLKVDIEPDPQASANELPYEYLFQDNEYDIVFLFERARRAGYDLYVQEGGGNGNSGKSALFFGPSTSGQPVVYELIYGVSLIQFTPNLTTANQVGKVTVRSWDPRRKCKIEHTATRQSLQTKGVGAKGRQSALERSFADREEVITDRPVESKAEARKLATETLEKIAKELIKGSGSTVGLPDLRAGSVVYIHGLGERFSGRYFVTATTHTIDDSGYTTQFECRREEKKD